MQRGLVGSEMCIRDRLSGGKDGKLNIFKGNSKESHISMPSIPRAIDYYKGNFLIGMRNGELIKFKEEIEVCLLYTSDAADDTPCVDLGGRRIIKKKKKNKSNVRTAMYQRQ
eukprot:TRINITY_DN37139_c0_g1_i1.p1 TRINITY_DN37139_c0_g1~~TRINITY_DN37139_c0_g1_i1.p1  ORF type:complete len:112 (-),score=30.28 TRINITY_DN37139_c0_g1_i1:89-424(-)